VRAFVDASESENTPIVSPNLNSNNVPKIITMNNTIANLKPFALLLKRKQHFLMLKTKSMNIHDMNE